MNFLPLHVQEYKHSNVKILLKIYQTHYTKSAFTKKRQQWYLLSLMPTSQGHHVLKQEAIPGS